MIDRGGSSYKDIGGKRSTFLGVDPGTLTVRNIRRKGKKDKAAADKHKGIVNVGIDRLGQRIFNALYYSRQAERTYETTIEKNVSPKLVESVKNNSTLYGPPKPNATSYNYSYGTGQYSGAYRQSHPLYNKWLNITDDQDIPFVERGRMAARRDTARDVTVSETYNRYTIGQEYHDKLIAQGESWIKDPDIAHWLGLDKDFYTDADVAEYERKYKQYEDYFKNYFKSETIWNSETNSFGTYTHIADDAPLPPWITPSAPNIEQWQYYINYESEVGKVLHDDAVKQIREQASFRAHPYKSAFNGQVGAIDSFADVVYSSSTPQEFWTNYKTYVRDYHLNPLLAGRFGTVLGNHLWNLMDTMDFASRGVRAFVAGDTVLGGVGQTRDVKTSHLSNTGYSFLGQDLTVENGVKSVTENDAKFKGQNVYWAHVDGYSDDVVQQAQEVFMRNGGYDLILRNHPELANKQDLANLSDISAEEVINNVAVLLHGDKALAEAIYEDIEDYLSGRSPFEDVKQGFVNVKKAYRDPAESFEADTGSTAANMIIETVLDPGLIIGSPAKGAAKEGAKKLGREAVENALTLFKNTSPELLDSKAARNALNAFIGSNEGRNILFKNATKLGDDAGRLAQVFTAEGIIKPADYDSFRFALTNALTGSHYKINGEVIGSQFFDELNKTRKLYKTAAWIDRGIDAIDTAIIKGSFIEPVLAAKLFKTTRMTARQNRFIRSFIDSNAMKKAEAGRTVADNLKGKGIVGNLEQLAEKKANNVITMEAYAEEMNNVKLQFRSVAQSIEHTYNELASASITPSEALERARIALQDITGSADTTIEDLAQMVSGSTVKGELDDAFHGLNRIYTDLMDFADNYNQTVTKKFFDEVRNVSSVDELGELVLKYSDNINIHDLRLSIMDNLPNRSIISEVELDQLLDDLSSGLLAERSATISAIESSADVIDNAATTVGYRMTEASEIHSILDHIDDAYKKAGAPGSVLKRLLTDNDPSVSKISKVINSFHTLNRGTSNENLIKAIDDTLVYYAEKKALGAVDNAAKAQWNSSVGEQVMAELMVFKSSITDALNTTGAESISVFHLDKMAKYDTVINDRRFSNLFDKLYTQSIKPVADLLARKVPRGTDAYKNVPVYQALMRMQDLRYSYDRYRRFVRQLQTLDLPDETTYAIRNGLFGTYGESGAKLIDVTRKPGAARSYIESIIYNEFGASRVGMENLTARLRTIDEMNPDPLIADYVEQINNTPGLREWYDEIITGDPADPETYIKTQMLTTLLMDPKSVERFNNYEQAPIFLHISTTGFGDQAQITGISYKKWKHIDVPEDGKLDMKAIKEAMETTESYNIKRVMSDDEIRKLDDSFLMSIYNNSIGGRSARPSKLRQEYKAMFGVSDTHPNVVSESEILEDFFSHIYKDTFSVERAETIIPSFVVHDLEGFNIPYINRRASLYSDIPTSRTADYIQRIAARAEASSINTFDEMRRATNDAMLTAEEFDKVEHFINTFAQDLSDNTDGEFNMLNIMDFPNEVRTLLDAVNGINSGDVDDEIMSLLMQNIDPQATDAMLRDAYESMTDIAALEDEAKQISAVSGMDRIRPLSGVRFDDAALEKHFGDEVNNALKRITDKLGINLVFDEINGNAAGYYTPSIGGLTQDQIHIDTAWKHNIKEIFIHEFRHNLADSGRGTEFHNMLLKRFEAASGKDRDLIESYYRWKAAQYPQFAEIWTGRGEPDYLLNEMLTPMFQLYMSSPDIMDDVKQLLLDRNILDTFEGSEALEILEDLRTILDGDFELDTFANAAHHGHPATAPMYEIRALEGSIINRFCSEAEVKEEFLNSLLNTVLDKNKFKQDIIDSVASHNPVRDAASAVGERVINTADKYHLNSIRKYFPGIGTFEDGIVVSFENIKRMSDISKWIDKKVKYSVRLGAEEFLQPYKGGFDKLINAVQTLAAQNASTASLGFVDSFAHLQYLSIPASATESYLLCQKLYDDFLKYWLNDTAHINYARALQDLAAGEIAQLPEEFRSILLAQFVNGLDFHKLKSGTGKDILSLLEGSGASNIFKDVPLTPSVTRAYTSHGPVKEGIAAAHRLKRAYYEMRAMMKDHEYLDAMLRSAGIHKKADYKLGLMYAHAADLDSAMQRYIMNLGDEFRPYTLDDVFEAVGDAYMLRFHSQRFNRLLAEDGQVDMFKVMGELLWNDANHIAFSKVYYSEDELEKLRDVVKRMNDAGADYVKLAEDRDTVAIYLTNDCKLFSNELDHQTVRYVYKNSDATYGSYYLKPELEHVSLPEFNEFKNYYLQNTGYEIDDVEEVYNLLKQCWDDVPLLSDNASRGTSGLVMFSNDVDEYYKRAKQLMPDLLSNEGLRDSDMYGHVIYDPGFMSSGNFDILTEFYRAMSVESNNVKTSGALINNVFGAGNEFSFGELAKNFSDEELAGLFNDNTSYDFVVCTLVPAEGTKTGLQVKQLRLNTKADVALARQLPNTAFLPYDIYLDVADAINTLAHPSELNYAINKLMLVYKASSLFHPGTWVRNFIDATQKSATDLGESPLNIFQTFGYELKAVEEINAYNRIMKWDSDFVSEANWAWIQQTCHTDMTYEDFELLKGVMESNRYVTKDKKLLQKVAKKQGGRVQLSGNTIGLRDLPEKEIRRAYDLAVSKMHRYAELPMQRNEFMAIYTGKRTPHTQRELDEYENMFRQISLALQDTNAIMDVNNVISASFIPFNYAETAVRYAQLKQLGHLGYSNNQALRHVHATQFRSSVQYGIPNKLEYIMPFITFKYNNLKYWMRMMDKNPKYFKYFSKLYGNVYDDSFENQADTNARLDFSSSHMMRTGGLPIGNGEYYFKINPSIFDSLGIMYNLPADAISSLNPLLKVATRYSMYQLGLDSKYIFQELDLSKKDTDPYYILQTLAPPISNMMDLARNISAGGVTFSGDEPTIAQLYKLVPSLIGKNNTSYQEDSFKDFQNELAKQGKWYDCNEGAVVPLSRKNEYGANDPNISWMDRQNFMMHNLNQSWDANADKFVKTWEVSEGGLNTYYDFESDPDKWDELCAIYAEKGMRFDYNIKKFVPFAEVSSGGLNDPDLSFAARVKLMEEKFPNLRWDSNQNAFVERDKYIAGGLNDVQSFSDVMLYRYVLFGETYDRETHKFYQTDESKVVTTEALYQLKDYNNYFAMLGIPRLPNVVADAHLNSEGLLVTKEGKYILTSNDAYNQRVYDKLKSEYGGMFIYGSRGRRYSGYESYSYNKLNYKRKPHKPYVPYNTYTPYRDVDLEPFYHFQFSYNYRYRNPQPATRIRRLVSPRVHYPYGGGYNKFSFYMR